MGEIQNRPFQLSLNASLKADFQGSRVASAGGLILLRELDDRLGFGELIAQHLTDFRGKNAQLGFADLLRQSVDSHLAGYEDLNGAKRLSQDPTFRLISSEKIWDRGIALTSRLQSFETEMLAEDANFAGLAGLSRAVIAKAEALDSGYRTVLDIHSKSGKSWLFGLGRGPAGTTGPLPLERMRKRWRAEHLGYIFSWPGKAGQAK